MTITVLKNTTIGTKAPEGWTLDSTTARQYGLCAFYMPKGKNFHNAPAIIYPRTSPNHSEIESVIKESVARMKSSKGFKVLKKKYF